MQESQVRSAIRGVKNAWSAVRPEHKYLNLAAIVLLGIVGFLVGPKDYPLGAYTAHIDLFLDGETLSVSHPFTLGAAAGDVTEVAVSEGGYRLLVEGRDAHQYALGQRIEFRLQVLDAQGEPVPLTLDQATSRIRGEGRTQTLPPTSRSDDGWLTFTLRIPYKAQITTGLLFAVAGLWLTELVPLSAASLLIPVVLVVTSVAEPGVVLQRFFDPIVVLFFAGFLLAEGMNRTGVDRIIALNILKRASLKPAYLMLTMISLSAFLSMWMSNTASVAMLIPIALAVLAKIPGEISRTGFRRALILGIAYAASVGGIGSAIGTPANMLAMSFLGEFAGAKLGFADWFAYGLPVVIIMVPIIWLYLLLSFRVRLRHVGDHLSHDVYEKELTEMGGLKKEQRLLLVVFMGIVALWLTDFWHGIDPAIVALGGVLILFFTETVEKEDISRINWDALLTFGGGLALGNILVLTGVSDWVALQLTGLVTLPPLLVVFLVGGITLAIGALISNTACAAMLIPLAIPLAQILHLDPRLLVAVVAIGSSIDFALVIGTPPTMMAYSTGLFKVSDIFKRGIVLDVIGIVILTLGVIWIWRWLGVITF